MPEGKHLWLSSVRISSQVLRRAQEAGRLQQLGFNEGRRFLTAARSGEIKQKDFEAIAPMGLYGMEGGPSVDFALGAIFEEAVENAAQELADDASKVDPSAPLSDDALRFSAEIRYENKNCQSLR